MRVRQADVLVETTPTGALVCDPALGVVHRLDTQHAHYLRLAATTGQLPDDHLTRHLLERAIVHQLADTGSGIADDIGVNAAHSTLHADRGTPARPSFTRRAVLATTVAGITTLALPQAAAASSTPTPAAPTGDLLISADPSLRDLWVLWEPVPGPFNYTWTVFNTMSGKALLATGTEAASYFDVNVYTVPSNISSIRLEVSSQTTPVVSDAFDTTF